MSIRYTIIGATGAVGREVLQILESRFIAASSIRVAASERSIGTTISYAGSTLELQDATALQWGKDDIAILAADAATARALVPIITAAGATAIDNSSAFRLHPDVPLVIPEVNSEELPASRHGKVIANPNCSTILLLLALEPLRRKWGVNRIVVSTYQAVSGAGLPAINELQAQTRAVLAGERYEPQVFHEPVAFNLFSHDSAVDVVTGLNGEERKIIEESRKIWDSPSLSVIPTCVRVPVIRAHTQSVCVTLDHPATLRSVRAALQSAPGISVRDDRAGNRFPTPHRATGKDDVLVGRLRVSSPLDLDAGDHLGSGEYEDCGDVFHPSDDALSREFCLLLCGDQLRKGAALNAIQIADALFSASSAVRVCDPVPA